MSPQEPVIRATVIGPPARCRSCQGRNSAAFLRGTSGDGFRQVMPERSRGSDKRATLDVAGRVTIDIRAEQPRIVGRIAARLGRLGADRRSLGGSLATAGFLQLVLVASGVIVARSLGAEDRGYLALLVVISGICTLLGSLGIFSAVTYYLARDVGAARPMMRSLRNTAIAQVAG